MEPISQSFDLTQNKEKCLMDKRVVANQKVKDSLLNALIELAEQCNWSTISITAPVSYTHLDVYKRQNLCKVPEFQFPALLQTSLIKAYTASLSFISISFTFYYSIFPTTCQNKTAICYRCV